MARKKEYQPGQAVSAPNPEGVVKEGVIEDNLSSQYFIRFDDGTGTFIFKNQQGVIKPL